MTYNVFGGTLNPAQSTHRLSSVLALTLLADGKGIMTVKTCTRV